MNYQFIVLMNNSKDMAIWAMSTANFLDAFTNIIVDNVNTNMRDILNGSLYPQLVAMTTPTDMYNIGDTVNLTYYPHGSTTPTTAAYTPSTFTTEMLSTVVQAERLGQLSSPYFIDGHQSLSQINSCKKSDIHLIITPSTKGRMTSSMRSVLFNYGLQN